SAQDQLRAAGAANQHRQRLCSLAGVLRRLRRRLGRAGPGKKLNHPTPAMQFGIVLRGSFSITTTDGETRRLPPGSVFRLEDTSPCEGFNRVHVVSPTSIWLTQVIELAGD